MILVLPNGVNANGILFKAQKPLKAKLLFVLKEKNEGIDWLIVHIIVATKRLF